MKPTKEVRQYLAKAGAKGGRVKGESKKRGDATYYRELAFKRVAKLGQMRQT